ncbi:MAG: hypothetical protein SV765_08960 [Pseudomonadota bacterium]|nr:hypothetical protein [Pseudomonadota bacterium]
MSGSLFRPVNSRSSWFRWGFYLSGCLVIALALVSYATAMSTEEILVWLLEIFTPAFAVLFIGLISVAGYSLLQLDGSGWDRFWLECALQAAAGLATLALTFTLLGISLGIGTLAQQELHPDTIAKVIQSLTGHFSTAFMTTVVGLPAAAIVRACASLRVAYLAVDRRAYPC